MDESKLVVEFLRESGARCATCGYALRGVREARCPECGSGVRLGVDAGERGRVWWLWAVLGAGTASAMAAGVLWVALRRIADHVATTTPGMVRQGFQPRLAARWQDLALAGALTAGLLGLTAWALVSRRGFSRWGARRRVMTGLALGVLPAAVAMVVWIWAVRR